MSTAEKVKYFAGIIIRQENGLWNNVKNALEKEFSPIDLKSETIPFTFTDYYEPQMGKDLLRFWIGFSGLFNRDSLPDWKIRSGKIEKTFKDSNRLRKVNIDPGYLALSKVVLASTKNYGHRIYIGKGILAEIEYIYRRGDFLPMDWTYPDYRSDQALLFFKKLREIYKRELSEG